MVLLWTCHSTAGLCICILDAQNILPSHSGLNNIKATGPRHCQALAAAAALHMEGVHWAVWEAAGGAHS